MQKFKRRKQNNGIKYNPEPKFNVGDRVIAWWPEGEDANVEFECIVLEIIPVFHGKKSFEYKLKSGNDIYYGIEGFMKKSKNIEKQKLIKDTFNGDNKKLKENIEALINLNDKGALYPHGIGGHARELLAACYNRIES